MSAGETKENYDASSFKVLKGLEPVRERPGMYTRTENTLHIIQEVIDNAADEALGGYASSITVTLDDDGVVTVEDNGRGIPVDIHPVENVPAVTLAFTRLHAGGKFDKKSGGAYAFAGGLHGVGVAVTTALSHWVEVLIKRDQKLYRVRYADGGSNIGDVETVGRSSPGETGTTVKINPDTSFFDSAKIPLGDLERLLRTKAVLLPGVKVKLVVGQDEKTWHYERGLTQYFEQLMGDHEPAVPLYSAENFVEAHGEGGGNASAFSPGEGGTFVFAWYRSASARTESYVNLIPTPLGGTHESGLKAGVYEAVKAFIEHHKLLPRNIKLQQEDVVAKMSFVLSAKVLDPQFQGQVKDKLNSREAYKLMIAMVRDQFETWLNVNVEHGKEIADIAISHAMARQNAEKPVEKRKNSGFAILPGKLTDCEAVLDNELFLVEGDSAGGSAKLARNKYNQALLPLRGKVLNTYGVERGKIFKNKEIHDISIALGVEPHDLMDDPKVVLANLRYTRTIIMTDADVDGSHIQTLLLTVFYSHMPHLLTQGHVFVALPPLYRIDVHGTAKAKPRRFYALNDQEKVSVLQRLSAEKVREDKIDIGRFKGLGEMNPDQLSETSMDPATRRVLPVIFDMAVKEEIDAAFLLCMDGDQASQRRDWMALEGATVEADI